MFKSFAGRPSARGDRLQPLWRAETLAAPLPLRRRLVFICLGFWFAHSAPAATREETFDREPPNWESINNRSTHFPIRKVTQDFGYSAQTSHAGGQRGEIGGTINPAGEPAWYGYRLPKPSTLNEPASASGKLFVPAGKGHFLLGFFNTNSLSGWRTPNTLALRVNVRGEGLHCHFEFCSSKWRSDAGVIGEIVPGERISAKLLPCDAAHQWRLQYDPSGGVISLTFDGVTATCTIPAEHRADGASFTHFGLVPLLKTWDDPGQVWLDDLTIQGVTFDFSQDPDWDASGNRRSYESTDTRPRFDFGWSPTHFAGGNGTGELGGLIFRGDCREPARMAAYGDRLSNLTLDQELVASGKVSMRRGISDSTASIGFYHSTSSLETSKAQDQSIPKDYLGINIEGPSSEGFYFYPVYRSYASTAGAAGGSAARPPRIYPDGKVHQWSLSYNPTGANGNGEIRVALDEQTCTLPLDPRVRKEGATFNRFGICTPWIDGNSVTVYFDDLRYTCAP